MLNLQSIKQFLWPSHGKIIVFIIFLSISFYFSKNSPPKCYFDPQAPMEQIQFCPTGGLDVYYYGFPLESISKDCHGSCDNPSWVRWEIDNYLNLFFDLIFWYLISCLLISAWNKIKGKKPVI